MIAFLFEEVTEQKPISLNMSRRPDIENEYLALRGLVIYTTNNRSTLKCLSFALPSQYIVISC